jgi:hypothetical protein
MNAIVPIPPEASLFAELAPDLTRASELARQEKAAATRRAYRSESSWPSPYGRKTRHMILSGCSWP